MSVAKQKGTAAETRVVGWLRQLGFYKAERLILHGRDDVSDIRIDPDIPGIIELKWRSPVRSSDGVKHRASSNHGIAQLKAWLGETVTEANNYSPNAWGVLMVNEFGKADPGDWRVYVPQAFTEARILRPHPSINSEGEHPFYIKVGMGKFESWHTVQMTGRDFMQWLVSEYGPILAERKRAHYDGEL